MSAQHQRIDTITCTVRISCEGKTRRVMGGCVKPYQPPSWVCEHFDLHPSTAYCGGSHYGCPRNLSLNVLSRRTTYKTFACRRIPTKTRPRKTSMNKLRKPPPRAFSWNGDQPVQSRTMAFALQTTNKPAPQPIQPSSKLSQPPRHGELFSAAREHYWVARAYTAETLLSASTVYHQELRVMAAKEEAKRSKEVDTWRRRHEAKVGKLERFALLLLSWLIALLAVIFYLLFRGSNSANPKKSSGVHFTVPILSPFTSVVENETSTISSRTLTAIAAIAAIMAYWCFRYWLRNTKH